MKHVLTFFYLSKIFDNFLLLSKILSSKFMNKGFQFFLYKKYKIIIARFANYENLAANAMFNKKINK